MKQIKWEPLFKGKRNLPIIRQLSEELNISPVVAILLYNRGCDTVEKAGRYISMTDTIFHDPFLFEDMQKAVDRIEKAVANGEKITIYGDYDVDGVTSVCSLYKYFRSRNVEAGYYIPSRSGEGYGMSMNAIKQLADDGANLIITVDTGITAAEEIGYAKSLGVDVIVTDHHECRQPIRDAVATINPKLPDTKYPFKDLAGVGVVFKLLCALEMDRAKREGRDDFKCLKEICDNYGDLIAIGTVADVMPLVDENRLIVSYGLNMIENRPGYGISALNELSGFTKSGSKKKITSSYISFVIAPRINAAGRIANASLAVELFLADNEEKAYKIAAELCEINKERQNTENLICEEVYDRIKTEHDFTKDPIVVLSNNNWHHGVIGIVCSRITDKYNVPSILVSFDDEDNGKGSGRSVKGINLVKALESCGDCLEKYGGHELAAGLSIRKERFEEFKEKINDYVRTVGLPSESEQTVYYECELIPSDISMKTAEELYLLEPYGTSNPVPVFMLRNAAIKDIVPIGGGKHTRLVVEKGGHTMQCVLFGVREDELSVKTGEFVDAAFNLDINEFRGYRTVQLIIKDIFNSADDDTILSEQKELYNKIRNGEYLIAPDDDIIPERNDFVLVYEFLRQQIRRGRTKHAVQALSRALFADNPNGYVKTKYIIMIMNEMNVIGISGDMNGDEFEFSLGGLKAKVDLGKSSILKILKSKRERPNKQ